MSVRTFFAAEMGIEDAVVGRLSGGGRAARRVEGGSDFGWDGTRGGVWVDLCREVDDLSAVETLRAVVAHAGGGPRPIDEGGRRAVAGA